MELLSILGFGLAVVFFFCTVLLAFRLRRERGKTALARAVAVQEGKKQERHRIASELHDDTMQSLYALGLRIEGSLMVADEVSPNTKKEAGEIRGALNEVITGLRSLVADLKGQRPEKTLQSVLQDAVKDLLHVKTAEIRFGTFSPPQLKLPFRQSDHVAAIVREAVANALRHGKATQITVSAAMEDDYVEAKVEDNGCGFSVGAAQSGNHYGFQHMQRRARSLNGTLEVRSEPGVGTTVMLRFSKRERSL